MKVSISIPAHNQEKIIGDAIKSCLIQDYEDKEILIIDDYSDDRTYEVIKDYAKRNKGIRHLQLDKNYGCTYNLQRCVDESLGNIVIFLCGDDMFTHPKVVSDMMEIFKNNPDVGIVDRNYYQYMDGYEGAVVEVREPNVIISSVNPSGMGFRKEWMPKITHKIYNEMPIIVKEMIKKHRWVKIEYDTIAVRIHKDNQALHQHYYTESMIKNWHDLLGPNVHDWRFKDNYICLKNRTGLKNLLFEIKTNISLEPRILLHPGFYFFGLLAILTPRKVLIWLSDFYRHRISRIWCKIRHRPNDF